MIEPLVVEFVVRASVEHAYRLWTEKTALWWPVGHAMSGDPARIEFEPKAGSVIREIGADGSEHIWGEVVAADPPHSLEFKWHLFFDASQATDVSMSFVEVDGATAITITQTGWERLGDDVGQMRRNRTVAGWNSIVGPFAAFVEG